MHTRVHVSCAYLRNGICRRVTKCSHIEACFSEFYSGEICMDLAVSRETAVYGLFSEIVICEI